MDVRQSPPRILYIATWIVVIAILGSLQWLIIAPPTVFANYQPLFKTAFDLVFGSIFIAFGLFDNSWFVKLWERTMPRGSYTLDQAAFASGIPSWV